MSPGLRVERVIDELRRGRAIIIETATENLAVLPLDLASDESLQRFARGCAAPPLLLISGQRAAVLNITNARAAAGQPGVAIVPKPDARVQDLLGIADPVADLSAPLKGPFVLGDVGSESARIAAIALVKLARLLPAAMIAPAPAQADDWLSVRDAAVHDYPGQQAQSLKIVARARVPLLGAEACEVVAFRGNDGALEHLAIVIGDPASGSPVLTRLHSECFTGDLLASLKCDCGPQLRGAIAAISQAGSGILLYLAQEGRGIGLINKLRAYALQDQGFDTVDANTRLGFENDERNFAPAARMLHLLNISTVRLMTNNPDKVTMLEQCGVTVAERVAHEFPSNAHNAHYLATKRDRSGHMLPSNP
jgi:GTP cyclohydrolase II